jgi:hypothetical protein
MQDAEETKSALLVCVKGACKGLAPEKSVNRSFHLNDRKNQRIWRYLLYKFFPRTKDLTLLSAIGL